MKWIDRLRQSIKQGYQCDCPKHRPKSPLNLGFVMSYVGVAVALSGLDGIDEKQYCSICHPMRNY